MPNFTIELDERERYGFHASDYGKMGLELYFAFKKVPQSNPVRWNETLKWGAGKGVELQMLKVLKDSGVVPLDYDQDKEPVVVVEREGVQVFTHKDAVNFNGEPIEIKSINNKNAIDIKKYADGNPRENYVGQLAIYMDSLGKDRGYMFVASVDGLSYFWLECNRLEGRRFQCGQVIVDLDKEYQRWAEIKKHVENDIEPDPFEFGRYKLSPKEVDWSSLSVATISAVRAGKKVIGDPEAWRILYSPWKDEIIKRQGVRPGYSEEELAEIREITKGFSTKKNDKRLIGRDVE